MSDYMNIKWKENPLEEDRTFLPDSIIESSYLMRFSNGEASFLNKKIILESPQKISRIPGSSYNIKVAKKSRFNTNEQQTLLRALKIIVSGRTNLSYYDKQDLELYNNSKALIKEENELYMAFATADFMKAMGTKPLNINPSIRSYANYRWLEKLKSVKQLPAFYKGVDVVSYSYSEKDVPVEMIHTHNVLDVGVVAKYLPATMTEKFFFKLRSVPSEEEKNTNSQLLVSEDKNIDKLLETYDVDIVMTFSALKRLMNFHETTDKWDIPIIIKECVKPNGIKKNVIYFDKPLPKLHPTLLDLNENCIKWFSKTNFCKMEGFKYPSTDLPINIENINTSPKKLLENTNVDTSDHDDVESVMSLTEFFSDEDDYELNKYIQKETDIKTLKRNKIQHNAFYKIWKLYQKEENNTLSTLIKKPENSGKSFNVLIRGKLDACETNETGTMQAVTVLPKLEYQVHYGGTICTKSELVKQWTHLYFKPCSNLYRVRTQYYKTEVIKIEPCNIHKVNIEAANLHNLKPHLGLGVIYKMAYELSRFQPGRYLLRHEQKNGTFASLHRECQEVDSDFNLHKTYEEAEINIEYIKPWTPIDPNCILPLHEENEHMPGMFHPRAAVNKSNQHWRYNKGQKFKNGKKNNGKGKKFVTQNKT